MKQNLITSFHEPVSQVHLLFAITEFTFNYSMSSIELCSFHLLVSQKLFGCIILLSLVVHYFAC